MVCIDLSQIHHVNPSGQLSLFSSLSTPAWVTVSRAIVSDESCPRHEPLGTRWPAQQKALHGSMDFVSNTSSGSTCFSNAVRAPYFKSSPYVHTTLKFTVRTVQLRILGWYKQKLYSCSNTKVKSCTLP